MKKFRRIIGAVLLVAILGGGIYLDSLMPVITGYAAKNLASAVFVCRKIYAQPMKKECFIDTSLDEQWCSAGDYHIEYIGEIVAAYVKK